MENINVVSTPNIEGNIGSCKTEVSVVTTGRPNFWTTTNSDIATNSCTGEVTKYDYWSISAGGFVTIFIIVASIIITVKALIDNYYG